ncbi:hypothetical protein HDU97_001532 [Phlyctochytrium planicorne]|nr:hypothetical protein HDU97_001532 [Phlyctochytrium planicorne]
MSQFFNSPGYSSTDGRRSPPSFAPGRGGVGGMAGSARTPDAGGLGKYSGTPASSSSSFRGRNFDSSLSQSGGMASRGDWDSRSAPGTPYSASSSPSPFQSRTWTPANEGRGRVGESSLGMSTPLQSSQGSWNRSSDGNWTGNSHYASPAVAHHHRHTSLNDNTPPINPLTSSPSGSGFFTPSSWSTPPGGSLKSGRSSNLFQTPLSTSKNAAPTPLSRSYMDSPSNPLSLGSSLSQRKNTGFGTDRGDEITSLGRSTSSEVPSQGSGIKASPGSFKAGWVHPAFGKVEANRRRHRFSEEDWARLQYNAIGILVLLGIWLGGYGRLILQASIRISPKAPSALSSAWIFSLIICLFNIGFALRKLIPSPEYKPRSFQEDLLAEGKASGVKAPRAPKFPAMKWTPVEERISTLDKNVFYTDAPSTTPTKTPVSSIKQRALTSSPFGIFPLTTSPAVADPSPIEDIRSLNSLLRETQGPRSPQAETAAFFTAPTTPLSPLFGGGSAVNVHPVPIASVGRFQTATGSLQTGKKTVKERMEGGFIIKEPQTVVNELNIEPYIDGWAEKMRWWLAEKVVKPLVQRIDTVDSSLREFGCEHLSCANATWTAGLPLVTPPPAATSTLGGGSSMFGGGQGTGGSLFGGGGISGFGASSTGGGLFGRSTGTGGGLLGASQQPKAPPANLYELFQQYGTQPLIQERFKIEHYLTFPGEHTNRKDVIDRIRVLARGGGLANYNWNGQTSSRSGSTMANLLSFFMLSSQGSKSSDAASKSGGGDFGSSAAASSGVAGGGGVGSSGLSAGLGAVSGTGAQGANSGGAQKKERVPTDAELVMHLFARFLDERMPRNSWPQQQSAGTSLFSGSLGGGQSTFGAKTGGGGGGMFSSIGSTGGAAGSSMIGGGFGASTSSAAASADRGAINLAQFSEKYLVDMESMPDPNRTIQIKQRSKFPPRFSVVYRREILEIFPDRNNVFQTLAIFAYIVSVTAGGYIGLLHLGGRSIEMTKVVEEGPAMSLFLEGEGGVVRSATPVGMSSGYGSGSLFGSTSAKSNKGEPASSEAKTDGKGKRPATSESSVPATPEVVLGKTAETPFGLNLGGGGASAKGVTFSSSIPGSLAGESSKAGISSLGATPAGLNLGGGKTPPTSNLFTGLGGSSSGSTSLFGNLGK